MDPAPSPQEEAPPSRITIAAFLERLTPHVWVTPTLVALIVAGFVFEVVRGASPMTPTAEQLLAVGGNFGPSVSDGEWWRVPASLFLHAGIIHIAFNLWAFWSIGRFAERVFGNTSFLAIYVLSGLGGGLASLAIHPLTVCVGASGAIFGVYGAVLAFVLLHKGVFPDAFLAQQRNSLFGFLGYNLVFSLSVPNVDLSAHGGGLVTGLLAGGLLGRDLARPAAHVARRIGGAAALLVAIALLGLRVQKRIENMPVVKGDRLARAALADLKARRLVEAIDGYTQALAIDLDAGWLSNRGLAHLWKGELPLALADFRAADAKEPTPRTGGLVCEAAARVAKKPEDVASAVKWCTAAIGRDGNDAQLFAWRASLHDDAKEDDLALEDAATALAKDPKNDMAVRVRLAVHLKQEKAKEAEADCAALLGRKDDPGDAIYSICAEVAHVQSDAKAERERLDHVLAHDPSNSRALLSRAALSAREGRYADTVKDYRASTVISPENAMVWNNLAWAETALGDFTPALADAERAVALVPDDASYLGTRCFAHAGLGEMAEARRDCARAVTLRPSLFDRGMLAFVDRRYGEARQLWQEASADPEAARDLAPWMRKLPAR